MADIFDPEKRSTLMAGIRSRDTAPEIALRKALFARGLRYRIHDRTLPGTPDLVFPRFLAVIFVNGCFWHAHDCHLFRLPGSRTAFWEAKLNGNRARDCAHANALLTQGWRVLTVWECALKGRTRLAPEALVERVVEWLESGAASGCIEGARPGTAPSKGAGRDTARQAASDGATGAACVPATAPAPGPHTPVQKGGRAIGNTGVRTDTQTAPAKAPAGRAKAPTGKTNRSRRRGTGAPPSASED
ncbi:DNA mismatch endonuclease Vsr [Phaeovibrio sulfidiphilus]|uniref:DNA mismatch endonuclease Vsr n=1 Tax=Phaeovibrio sulfidiphilus TaxID=1220600 RepID=A0A8J7CBT3_9PROT|nr:very short patch repair endonuclease [Phaeovibrio sulfidiphilus]MBE1236513.1 DNA mismatch endonuclease Vsr [Phaeovibrio sulfidiphilus]